METELQPERLKAILAVLKDFKVASFKSPEFSVKFESAEEEPATAVDGIGFVVPPTDNSANEAEDIPDDGPFGMHRRMFSGDMPSLIVKRPKQDPDHEV